MYRSIVQKKDTDADNVKPAGLHDVEAKVVVSHVFGCAVDDLGLGLADLQVPIMLRVLHVKLEAVTRQHEPWKGKQEQK